MDKVEDGGPAFARGDPINGGNPGMSLRDYFAAHAIHALIFKSEDRDGGWSEHTVAAGAYLVADAMLLARKAGDQS